MRAYFVAISASQTDIVNVDFDVDKKVFCTDFVSNVVVSRRLSSSV